MMIDTKVISKELQKQEARENKAPSPSCKNGGLFPFGETMGETNPPLCASKKFPMS